MLELCTLASGSSGNCRAGFRRPHTALLLDAGISAKRICDGLKQHRSERRTSWTAYCITHAHYRSHQRSAGAAQADGRKASMHAGLDQPAHLERQVEGAAERIEIIHPQEEFQLGDLSVQAFNTPHDAPGSVGYTVSNRERKCSIVTDLGFVTEEVRESILGSQLALVEANHDVDWLHERPLPALLEASHSG